MLGMPGEWDAPDGVVAKRDTMYLSVGIPDSATLPRAALNAAMQKVLAENGDASRMPIERLVELLPKESGSAQALLSGTVENVIPNKNEKVLADDVAALAVRRAK